MRLAGLVAAEAVKDSERSPIDPEGVPGNRSGLLGDETQGPCKKCGDLFFALFRVAREVVSDPGQREVRQVF